MNWIERRFTLIFAALAALGSIGAVIVAYGQWSWVFAAERAYLLGAFSGYGGRQPTPNIEVNFSFKNYGKTPGEYRDATARCQYSQTGIPEITFAAPMPGFSDDQGRTPPGLIVETGNMVGPFPARLEGTAQQIDQARIGVGKIYCQALLLYEDVRNNAHKTRVCWVYNFGASAFILCPEKGANYHD